MKYVKIRDVNYNEALLQLKREYGDDAIPISHKYVKEGGIFNSRFLAKDVVELTAAVQDRRPEPGKPAREKKGIDLTVGDNKSESLLSALKKVNVNEQGNSDAAASIMKTIDNYNRNPEIVTANTAGEKKENSYSEYVSEKNSDFDKSKTAEDKTSNSFEEQISDLRNTLNKLSSEKKDSHMAIREEIDDEFPVFKPYIEILKNNDYDTEERGEIINEFRNSVSRDDLKDKYKIEKSFKELLMSRIVTTGPFKMTGKKKVVMFIGPTGVGKTTTMAKLGALYSLREGQNVSFITLDNYRIAATEQLKKYAEIMRIPVDAINDEKTFRHAIEKDKSGLIMVDTSGRSHRNDTKIEEIKNFADAVNCDCEKVLCVSANTKKRDLDEIFKSFEPVKYNSVIITKVDETSFLGNVVDIADKYNKPISYFTHGQEVPNDITVAESEKIADIMVGGTNII